MAGQQGPPGADNKLTILPKSPEFKQERVDIAPGEIDAMDFLRFLADYTGLPVILDSSNPAVLTQKIVIAAKMKDVTADVVIAVLQANRFLVTRQVLPSGTEVLNVVSQTQGQPAQGEPTETPVIAVEGGTVKGLEQSIVIEGLNLRPDEIATMVFTLKYTQPADAIQSLNSLVGGAKQGAPRTQAFSIVDVKNSMLVIVTAKFGLLNYIAKLLSIIDVPIKETERIIQIIEVENADADELTALIQQFLQGRTTGGRFGGRGGLPAPVAGQPGQPVAAAAGRGTQGELQTNLIPDWRTQKIIVETYSERDLEDIHMLVRELDTRFDIRRLKTRIYQVNYLKAEEVASDLQLLLGGASGGFSGRAGLGSRGAAGTGGAGTRSRRSSGVSRVSGRTPGAGVGGPTPSVAGGAPGGSQSAPIPALIVPHIQTNSLIIQAEPEEYAEILSILEQIDIKRRQVFLEAALVQVTTTSQLLYTIELLAGEPNDTATRALFESSFGLSGIDLAEFDRTLPDLSAPGSVPPGALLAIMHRGKFPALVRFFKSNTESEVLATPFILADDNQQNVIEILETRYVANTSTGSSQVTTTSQQGEDAGITLEITPTISSQSALYLELSLSVSQFEPGGGSETVLPPRTENTITSAVTIPDGDIFVIGGLTREGRSKSISKVPIVGDLPLIGKLFRSESTNKSASNLYIFLRAHVLTHPAFEDGKDITRQAMDGVYAFAPNLEPTRFVKPQVTAPPPKARDPDEPTRFYPTRVRSRAQQGFEAPQGPYRTPTPQPTGSEGSYQRDPEDPGHQQPPGAGPGTGATRAEPRQTPTPTAPPQPPKPLPPPAGEADLGGLEMPPITDTPPAGVEPGSEPALDGTGMERDPEGDSWFVPLRPKTSTSQ
jgi:general secretion pathway protein D